ncbi:dihydrolipoyl dehydrogenase family protein [Agarilytica rhodophyticola]|uniref:dihydrolipoyl dehydrogenase family protein n=1 Tax=Agarilytica rhodophyticola TaxID=1737490 RepID=UPI000B341DDB|nr:NAD(P)/FAD-dependent oxidoreductase [Agarilytica rhodophyticola]
MSNKHYDVIIIGGGNAGFGVSQIVHPAGKSIAFIEPAEFGGTCPNRGCTPKKVLVAAANAMHEIKIAHTHGIEVGEAKLNWNKLISRKNDLIDFIPGAMEGTAQKRGDIYKGKAKFINPTTVEVNDVQLEADNFVIATGSTHRPLTIPGAELLITSDEVLSETEQPEEVIFIGGGVVAMEFSHVYARAGTKVTILEMMPQLLPRLDKDAVAQIHNESERIGINIKTAVEVKGIEQAGDKLQIQYVHEGKTLTAQADRIINGAGRIANVAELNLEAGDIQHNDIRIEVDENLRSVSNPRVWVAGDALVSSPQLSPVATYEGRIVGNNIVNNEAQKPDYSVLPSAVYTVPAISSVGFTEADCEREGLEYEVRSSDMSTWFSARFYSETVAWSKIIVEKSTRKILGAHIVGHHGEELIHIFALAMRHNISIDDLLGDFYAFPTFAADIKSMF